MDRGYVQQEWLGKFPEARREELAAWLAQVFRGFHQMTIDIASLIARPPINVENERQRGFDDGRLFDARSFKEFLAHARAVRSKEDTNIPYFHGYLRGMLSRMLRGGPERAATIARVLRDFAHRWHEVLAAEPPLISAHRELRKDVRSFLDSPAIARRPMLHIYRALARDASAGHVLWEDDGALGAMMGRMVTDTIGRGIRGNQGAASIVASFLFGSPALPLVKRYTEAMTDVRDDDFLIYRDQLSDEEKALQREDTKRLWALVVQDVMKARRAQTSSEAVASVRAAYVHLDHALVRTYGLFTGNNTELGRFVATSAEVIVDELSHIARAPAAADRNIYWDALMGRLLRELGAALSVGLRPLRRYESIGPARQVLRNAENQLYQILAQRTREAVRTNRLDPLITLGGSGGDDRPLLARGSSYFLRWFHEGDREIGRCVVASVPWAPTQEQGAYFEILESRDLRHHVRAFVKWQAPGNPFTYTVIRHVRPEDFATVKDGEALVGHYRERTGESALTGILYPMHREAAHPGASTLISAIAFLMARGIYYRRWTRAFALQPLGNRGAFVAGFAAWTRTRPADYIVQVAEAIDPTRTTDIARRIAEEYAERTAGRALPPLVQVITPPAPVPSSTAPLPIPQPRAPPAPAPPTAPSILPPRPMPAPSTVPATGPTAVPWSGLELTADLTRSSAFDALTGPMQIHVAAQGTLNRRRVYVELVDARIYDKYQAPLGAAASAFVRTPQNAWKIPRDEVAARWPMIWADALAKMALDVNERRAELEKLKRLLVPQTESVFLKDFQFHTRTIEPIDYVPLEGDLTLLVYDEDEWEAVTGRGLLPDSSDERDASPVARLLKMVGEAQGVTMAHGQGAVLDYFAFVRRGDEFRIRGLDCFLAWPLYAAYVKRPLHGFYELQDEEAETEEPDITYQTRPEALSDAIGEEAWQTAAAEYTASPNALAERIVALTGLPWPDAAADSQSLVFCAAYCLAKGLTTASAFHAHVQERVDFFYTGIREVTGMDDALLARLRDVAEGNVDANGPAEILFSVSGRTRREGGDRDAFLTVYEGDAHAFVENYQRHDALLRQLRDEIRFARVYEDACTTLAGPQRLEDAKRTVAELKPLYDEAKAVDEAARSPAQADAFLRTAAAKRVISGYALAGSKVAALAGLPSVAALEKRKDALRAYVDDDARFIASDKAAIALGTMRQHNNLVIKAGVRVAEQLTFNARAHGALQQGAAAAFFLETMCTIERMRALTSWPLSYWVGQLIEEDAVDAFALAVAGQTAALQAYCSDDMVFGANILRFVISSAATDALEEERAKHPIKLIARLLATGGLDNGQDAKLSATAVATKQGARRQFLTGQLSNALAELNSKFQTPAAANNAKLTAPAVSAVLVGIARRFREMTSPAQSERVARMLTSGVRFFDDDALRTQRLSDLLAFRISDVPPSALVSERGLEATIARGTVDGEFSAACSAVMELLLTGADRDTIQRDLMGELVATSLGAANAFATTVTEKAARAEQKRREEQAKKKKGKRGRGEEEEEGEEPAEPQAAARAGAEPEAGYQNVLRWDTVLAEWGHTLFTASAVALNRQKEKKSKKKLTAEEEEEERKTAKVIEENRDSAYRILSTTAGVHAVVAAATRHPDAVLRPSTVVPPPPTISKKERFLGLPLPAPTAQLPLPAECTPLSPETEELLLSEYVVVDMPIPPRFMPAAGEEPERGEVSVSGEEEEEEEEVAEAEEAEQELEEEEQREAEQEEPDVMDIVEEEPAPAPLKRLKRKEAPPLPAPLPVPPATPTPARPAVRRVIPRPLAPGEPLPSGGVF